MNVSPSMRATTTAGGQRLDISRTLQPVSRAMGLTRIARGAVLGFAAGALLGTGVLVAAHLWQFGFSVPVALLSLASGLLVGMGWGLVRWPRNEEAARAADLYFGLDDRLTTALELRSSDAPVARAQSRDTAQSIDGLALGKSRGAWLRRREAGIAAVAALAFAASLVLGPATHRHHAPLAAAGPANTQRVRRAAANQIKQLRAQLHLGLTPGEQQTKAVRKLDLALSRLRRQLMKAATTRASLRAISATQQQLHQLAAGLHPINARAVAQLNGSLAHYLGARTGSRKTGTPARSSVTTAQALNRLAQSLAHLSPAQRAALARALARAANATSNTSLRSSLRQAASSLANGSPRAAGAALRQAARSLSQSAATRTAQSRAATVAAQLGALKTQLANPGAALSSGQLANLPGGSRSSSTGRGMARGSRTTGFKPSQGMGLAAGQGQGKGLGLGKGQGKGNGQGARTGQGSGVRPGGRSGQGNGRGRGSASRQGQGTATRAGTGTSGAHGFGGRGRSNPTKRGRTVTVYIPGTQGKGPEIIKNGPNGAPQTGALVPYQQVLGRYVQQTHQALDRASLPPAVQSYVRRYFSTISH